jgi:hypothetical protein
VPYKNGYVESSRIATKMENRKISISVINRKLGPDMILRGKIYNINTAYRPMDMAIDMIKIFSKSAISKKEAEGLLERMETYSYEIFI